MLGWEVGELINKKAGLLKDEIDEQTKAGNLVNRPAHMSLLTIRVD